MATTGKKINELTAISTVSDQTVLPAVYVDDTTTATTATKIAISQISTKVQNDMSSALSAKQDKLTAGDNITIENNVISAEVPSLPENIYTEENLVAGDGITLTKEDNVTTITATTQVPDNVWTQDNLKAGDNVTITQVQKPVIDGNTTALWHFDQDFNDVINNRSITLSDTVKGSIIGGGKFDKYWMSESGNSVSFTPSADGILYFDDTSSFTFDCWMKALNGYGYYKFVTHNAGDIGFTIFGTSASSNKGKLFISNKLLDNKGSTSGSTSFDIGAELDDWFHLAFVQSADTATRYVFLNGRKIVSSTYTPDTGTYTGLYSFSYTCLDELRVSNKARWTSDFTPFNQPYAAASGPTEYQINAIVPQGGSAPTLTWYTGNTGTTVTIADTTSASLVKVYKNGILLQPTEDYSISGTTLTLVSALESQDKITTEVFA